MLASHGSLAASSRWVHGHVAREVVQTDKYQDQDDGHDPDRSGVRVAVMPASGYFRALDTGIELVGRCEAAPGSLELLVAWAGAPGSRHTRAQILTTLQGPRAERGTPPRWHTWRGGN